MQKSKLPPKTIDAYIAGFPVESKSYWNRYGKRFTKAAPKAEEAIKYGMPTFVLNGNPDPFRGVQEAHSACIRCRGMWRSSGGVGGVCGGEGDGAVALDGKIPWGDWGIVRWRVMRGGAP